MVYDWGRYIIPINRSCLLSEESILSCYPFKYMTWIKICCYNIIQVLRPTMM